MAETGTRAERTRVAVVGPRLAECGMNGAGSLTTSRPGGPHSCTDKPGGPDSEWRRTGQAEQWVASRGPTLGTDKPDKQQGATQGSSRGK